MNKKIYALLIACALAPRIHADTQTSTSQSAPTVSSSVAKYAQNVSYYGLATYLNYLAADTVKNVLVSRFMYVGKVIAAEMFDPARDLPVIARSLTISAVLGSWVFNNMKSAYKSSTTALFSSETDQEPLLS